MFSHQQQQQQHADVMKVGTGFFAGEYTGGPQNHPGGYDG